MDELGEALKTLKAMGVLDRLEELTVGRVQLKMCNALGAQQTAREQSAEELAAARDAIQFAASSG